MLRKKQNVQLLLLFLTNKIYSIKIIYMCIFLSNTACIYYYHMKEYIVVNMVLRLFHEDNMWVQHRWKFPCVLSFSCQDTRFWPCFSRLKLTTQRVMFLISSYTPGGWKSSFSHWIISHYKAKERILGNVNEIYIVV